MFRNSNFNVRKGALMIGLLVSLVLIGLFSLVMLPEEQIQNKRLDEEVLAMELSQLRNAVALERIASQSSLYYGNWENKVEFVNYLDDLVARGFIGKIPQDPFCPAHEWGTNPGQKFWVPTRNLLGSSSFETDNWVATPWIKDETNIVASSSSLLWPGSGFSEMDNFPYENRFGTSFEKKGRALVITIK
jgi:hypothetical protein